MKMLPIAKTLIFFYSQHFLLLSTPYSHRAWNSASSSSSSLALSVNRVPMESNQLPEDIIVQILNRLPIKSLIRFSCVSKRWHYIIFYDPKFAKSQFKLVSGKRRLLISSRTRLISLDLETPSFGDNASVRKLTCPFNQPGRSIFMLGSCNGMVFVAVNFDTSFYIWNPSTGFFKKLPAPGFASEGVSTLTIGQFPYDPSNRVISLEYCGFGYVSASDDYKVVVCSLFINGTFHVEVEIFSFRANIWKRIEADPVLANLEVRLLERHLNGTLSNEAVHWLRRVLGAENLTHALLAFDLAKEEFREVPLPNLAKDDENDSFYRDVGVLLGGCLCVSSYKQSCREYAQLWVMMEYGVGESWRKLYKFETVDMLVHRFPSIFYAESGITIVRFDEEVRLDDEVKELIRYCDNKEESLDKVAVSSGRYRLEMGDDDMLEYDESLLWLNDIDIGRRTSLKSMPRKRQKKEK